MGQKFSGAGKTNLENSIKSNFIVFFNCSLQYLFKALFDVTQFAVKLGIGGHPQTRMGHEVAVDFAKTGVNMLPKGLKLRMLLVIHFEPSVQDVFAAFEAIIIFIGVAPVSDQEHELLKGRLARVLKGQSAIFGKELQMLQVVLLNVGRQVVD